jgi:hypothetical protein
MNRLAEFVDRAFQNTPLQPDQWKIIRQIFILSWEKF